jgi:hypothetical protein
MLPDMSHQSGRVSHGALGDKIVNLLVRAVDRIDDVEAAPGMVDAGIELAMHLALGALAAEAATVKLLRSSTVSSPR